MQHIIALLLVSTASLSMAYGQSCLPEGIQFGTPWMLDAFVNDHPGCTHIEGSVTISGSTDPITDLTQLSQITSIGGDLVIQYCLDLETLVGLDNITSVGGDLIIENNMLLSDLSALENVTSVGGDLELLLNGDLTSLTGLGSVAAIGGRLSIRSCNGLTDLQGLEGLASIGNGLTVESNNGLVSLNGLGPVNALGGALWLKENPLLADLSAVSGLTSVGAQLNLQDNASLASLEGLSSITALGGYLRVQDCPLLTDLSPLQTIDPTTITQLLFQDLPGVSNCALDNICAYLALPDAQPTIANNASGCASVAEVEAACSTTSIADPTVASAMALQLFPNPSAGIVQLQADVAGSVQLRVMDLAGRAVHEERSTAGAGWRHTLHLGHLWPGGYLLQVQSEQGIATARLIIE